MDAELNAWTWLARVLWALALAALTAVAVWTLVRLPGRGQDPGLPRDDKDTQEPGAEGGEPPDEDPPWRGGD